MIESPIACHPSSLDGRHGYCPMHSQLATAQGGSHVATTVTRESVLTAIADSSASPESHDLLAVATRLSLQWFAQQFPGQSVEIRVPPYRAIQILGGTTHRRGTPPAVVEMSAQTWLSLFQGTATWDQACASGFVLASGERSDLSVLFAQIIE